jgi:hypothetical protein
MAELALEEREALGLTPFDPLDPYALASEHGISVYPIETLAEHECPADSIAYFTSIRVSTWSAALIPVGSARLIIENTAHQPVRRRSSIAHELGHHLLEHDFAEALLGEDGCPEFDPKREKEANHLAGELLIPSLAAKRAAFDDHDNARVARQFGVSEQFAQMRLYGPREYAKRARAKQRRAQTSTSN